MKRLCSQVSNDNYKLTYTMSRIIANTQRPMTVAKESNSFSNSHTDYPRSTCAGSIEDRHGR